MIRDQNVEASEGRDGGRYELLRPRRSGKIALDGAAVFRATFAHQVLGLRLRRLIIEDNFRAGGHKQPHCRRADSARAAGDKSNFGIESQVHNAYKYRTAGVGGRILDVMALTPNPAKTIGGQLAAQ